MPSSESHILEVLIFVEFSSFMNDADNSNATHLESLEQQLSLLAVHLREEDSRSSWQEVENVAHTLADGLRVRDGPVDLHTLLGRTNLPHSLFTLFELSLHGSHIPDDRFASPLFEILRVAANLCMDHDDNRGFLLREGLLQELVSLLSGYVELADAPPSTKPLEVSISHLKIIRTAIGVLLNASIGYEAVKEQLRSLEAPLTIAKLSAAVYPTGSWVTKTDEIVASRDAWLTRCTISSWAWRMISEFKDARDEIQIFTPDVLPYLVLPLSAILHPATPTLDSSEVEPTIICTLINADLEALQECCMLIESLSLDIEDIRLSLARGLHFPAEHSGIPCLSVILDFVENGNYPSVWEFSFIDEADKKRKSKLFDICKGALIKSVVEVAGEDKNEDVLWDDLDPDKPGGAFVDKMVSWLREHVHDAPGGLEESSATARDDMIICASLSLGNLARREKISVALLSPPYCLAPILASKSLLYPSTDLKVKHGVLGLLKHLAQAPPRARSVHHALGEAGIIQSIVDSSIWDERIDTMAEIVQLGAIGVVKHMCSADVEHTLSLVLSPNRKPEVATGLAQILALVKRSDSIPLRCEGSRVVVNVVKSLWSNQTPVSWTASPLESPADSGINKEVLLDREQKRSIAIRAILIPECARTLANLIMISRKYPLLVHEGVVAMNFLSIQKEGAALVLTAITTTVAPDTSSPQPDGPPKSDSSQLSETSSTSERPTPRHALDMLVLVLKNEDTAVIFPIEMRVNVCSLFFQLGKFGCGDELFKVKETVKPILDSVAGNTNDEKLTKAIQRLADSWSS